MPGRVSTTTAVSAFAFNSAGIDFDHIALSQLRGGEWERDYSPTGRSPSLLMPSIDLVIGELQWEGRGSWLDADGVTQAMDPWWWSDRARPYRPAGVL
jgi:hypothetical protein